MKIQTKLCAGVFLSFLVACSSQADPAPGTGPASSSAPEIEIPSQSDADELATSAIDEANADQVLSDLEKEIQDDM